MKKHWKSLDNKEKSRIFYAYTARSVCNEKLYKGLFNEWIKTEMSNFTYSELANVAYGLMYLGETDK